MKEPAYYVAYDASTYTLIVRIHETLADPLQDRIKQSVLIPHLQKKLPDIPFEPLITSGFGFAACSEYMPVRAGFVSLAFQIPKVAYTDMPCLDCKGTGHASFPNEEMPCYFCKGKKKEIEYGKEKRFAICQTLYLLFRHLEYALTPLRNTYGQHAVLVTLADGHGHMGVGGGISRSLFNAGAILFGIWRSTCPLEYQDSWGVRFAEAEACMARLWQRMNLTVNETVSRSENCALLHVDGHFYIQCPGENGCSLSTMRSGPSYYFEAGVSMGEHNVDNTIQQLTLLAGFAKVYETLMTVL